MNSALLRNLGVNETIIKALQKSYGEEYYKGFEIMQDKHDLRLLLKRNGFHDIDPHILTLPGFCKKDISPHNTELDVAPPVERYNCNDTLEFLPASSQAGENLKINGVGVRLSDAQLKLLRYFAQKMVDTESGWVYIQDMRSDGVISLVGYQSFSRLRSAIAGYLLKKNAKDLIEANGRKQYRLSISPKNIRLNKD